MLNAQSRMQGSVIPAGGVSGKRRPAAAGFSTAGGRPGTPGSRNTRVFLCGPASGTTLYASESESLPGRSTVTYANG